MYLKVSIRLFPLRLILAWTLTLRAEQRVAKTLLAVGGDARVERMLLLSMTHSA